MANLGIVIAVSEYNGDAKNLPACREDGASIVHVLKASGRFDDILHIESDTIGTNVKQRLAEFAKAHKGKEINEVFFYFTGHGEFVGEEFYYLLTDYQTKRRNQTSLENSELDGIVRSLSPKLFVKVVDACHSGVSYIKTSDDFRDYLKAADQKFEKLYFMFSSQSEQFSYQNDKISYFTESILKSIFNHSTDTIRYKDVISYVSDEFKEYGFQTPLFVTQADFTEVFCDVTTSVKDRVKQYIQESRELVSTAAPDSSKVMTLASLLSADAKAYCSKEEASEVVSFVLKAVEKRSLRGDMSELFSRQVSAEQNKPPAPGAIGRWLDKGTDEKKYFARASKVQEAYKKQVTKSIQFRLLGLPDEDPTYVDAVREVIGGYAFTTDMPFEYIKVRLEPKLPNITPEESYIVPIVSKTHLRLFSAFAHFEYVDWDKSSRVGKIEWATDEVPLRDKSAIEQLVNQIDDRFTGFVEEPLKARWSLAVDGSLSNNSPDASQDKHADDRAVQGSL